MLNMLSDLRSSIENDILMPVAYQYANTLQETLVRHIGCIEDNLKFYKKEIKNPFKCLLEGVREIIVIPAYVLSGLGIISKSFVYKLISSVFFKVISGFFTLVCILSAIVSLIIGWDEFVKKLTSILTKSLLIQFLII